MRSILVAVLIFATIPMILVKPHVGILVFSWISYMNPHRLAEGFAYDFRFAFIIAAITVIAWLVSREEKRLEWTPPVVLLALLTVWLSFTTLFALNAEDGPAGWERSMKIMMMAILSLTMLTSRRRVEALTWVIVLSIGYFGVKGGLFTLATGGQYRVWGPPESFIEDNNDLSIGLLMILPLAWYLYGQVGQRWLRWALAAGLALTAVAIIGSYSRGAFIAASGVAVYFWFKSPKKLPLGIILTILVLVALAMVPDAYVERILSIRTYASDQSASTRLDMWHFALSLAIDRPFVGGGFGAFYLESLYPKYWPQYDAIYNVHSIYFQMLGEHGFIGLVLFLALAFTTVRTGTWIIRQARGRPDLAWASRFAAMLQVSLLAYAVGGAFLNLAYFDLPYHIVVLMVSTRRLVARELAAPTVRHEGLDEARTAS